MQSVDPSPALWAQLLTALVIGLLTTIAFQFLLTSLGVALGISVLSLRPTSPEVADDGDNADSVNPEAKSWLQIDSIVGLSVVGTVNLGLFAACFLAAKFSQLQGPAEGAIAGITIWSAYLLLVIWVSAQTVNTAVSFLLDRATGGLRKVVGAIAQFFQPSEPEPISADKLMASVREEIQTALRSSELRALVEEQLRATSQDALPAPYTASMASEPSASPRKSPWEEVVTYLEQANAKNLTTKRVDRQLRAILHTHHGIVSSKAALTSQDIAALGQCLEQRDDLSEKRKQRILTQIEKTWQRWQENLELQEELSQAQELLQIEPAEAAPPISLPTKLVSSAVDLALEQVVETVVGSVRDGVVGSVRDGAFNPLDSAQAAIAHQVNTLQNQVQSQAEATRRVAVKAAWWLFTTASTGAISATIAGALATGWKFPSLSTW
ncbi:MAG TPA: hypothetical protein V6D29_08590 [Leptolyngbyaceae cyanobacterium]